MNNINITTELCAEDRARIDRLTTALERLVEANAPVDIESRGGLLVPATPNPFSEGIVEAPAEPESVPEEVGAPAEEPDVKEVPEHTQAELQQKVISLVSGGKKDEVKKIIEQYAPRVSAIPAEKINEVWDKLTALEG